MSVAVCVPLFNPTPLALTKERHEFVRNLLETSSAELAQYFLQSFVFIHRLLTSSVCVPRCESPSIASHLQCVLHCSRREQRPLSCGCFAYVYDVRKRRVYRYLLLHACFSPSIVIGI